MSEEEEKDTTEEPAKESAGEDNADEENSTEEKKSSNLMLIIIIAVAVLAVAGGAYFFFMSGEETPKEEKPEEKLIQKALYVSFPDQELLAELRDKDKNRKYIRLKFVVMTRDKEAQKEIENNNALVVSAALDSVQSSSYERLVNTINGKKELRVNMLESIQRVLPKHGDKVEQVLITNFLMD